MTRLVSGTGVCIALLVASVSCSRSPGMGAAGQETSALETLRAATTSFASLDAAVAAGYARDVAHCLVHEHHGAMGYHHVNAGYMDGIVDVGKPEILLYERLSTGEYRLNGVEYIVPYGAWSRDSIPPRVFDQPMRREENLEFWYLHVWAWTPNPDGLFADFHPQVRCSPESRRVFRPNNGESEDALEPVAESGV